VRFIETRENLAHQHSPDDVYAYVTPEYTARVARAVAVAAATLARAPEAPALTGATRPSRDTLTLSWTPPSAPGPDVASYVVRMRLSSETLYRPTVATATADARSISIRQLDLGIPDQESFFVSVAAVDAEGHESPFASPEVRCTISECVIPPGSQDPKAVRPCPSAASQAK
jgi:hypothetical protein